VSDDFENNVLVATTFYVCKEINERNLLLLSLIFIVNLKKSFVINECKENVVINMIATFHYMRLMKLNRVALRI